MAAGEILIKWVSESSDAIRDMRRVDSALGDSASKTDRAARRMATAHKVVNGAIVAWTGALLGGAYVMADFVKMAQEDAAAQAKLETVAKRSAKATDLQVDAMNDYINSVAAATTYTDDELRPAMASLVSVTQDTERSQRLLTIAMDASATSGKPVASVATAISKAYDGNATSLKRMFPFLDEAAIKSGDFSAIMKQLADNTKGAAEAGAAKDQWTVFQQNLDETKEALGGLANSKGGVKVLSTMNKYLADFTAWIDAHPDSFDKLAKGIAGVTAALVALKGALLLKGAVSGLAIGMEAVGVATGRVLGFISSPLMLAAGWVAFERWVDDMSNRRGGLWTVLSWVKDIADFLSNPVGNAFEISIGRVIGFIVDKVPWLERAARAIGLIKGSSGGSTGNISLGATGSVGVSRAPSLAGTSTVGRIQPQASQSVNVWVGGQRQAARVAAGPVWQPQIALGVV